MKYDEALSMSPRKVLKFSELEKISEGEVKATHNTALSKNWNKLRRNSKHLTNIGLTITHEECLKDMDKNTFDIFKFSENVKRENCLPVMATFALVSLDLDNLIEQEKIPAFTS